VDREELAAADVVVDSLAQVSLAQLHALATGGEKP
jgi:hypothetical protein